MNIKSTVIISLALLAVLLAPSLTAEPSGANNALSAQLVTAGIKKTAFAPAPPAKNNLPERSVAEQGALVFTAPPRESLADSMEIYQPVAEYLGRAIGKKITYKHPGTWSVYRTEMLKGSYDIVFDGPHFNGYRMEKLNHNVLVKIPEQHEFAVIVRKEQNISGLSQTVGRTFCAQAPPSLGTLVLLSQFENPARQPIILSTNSWDGIYQGVVLGKCIGGVLPIANLRKLDGASLTKVVFKTEFLPNQAFSAGPRLSNFDQTRLGQALVSPAAAGPTLKLRTAYKVGDRFALANNQEYQGLAAYLKNEWGYY